MKTPLPPGHRFFPDAEREAWARWIEWFVKKHRYGWFGTMTFQDWVSPYKAHSLMEMWLARLTEALRRKRGQWLNWMLAEEWQIREVIHFHVIALGDGLDSLSRKSWESRWEALAQGFCRIHDANLRVAPYLAKYTSKSRGGEIQWGGAWRGLETPASVVWDQAYHWDPSISG